MPTSSVLVAEIGEPPHVSQADGDRDAGEQEVPLVAPLAAFHAAIATGAVATGAALGLYDLGDLAGNRAAIPRLAGVELDEVVVALELLVVVGDDVLGGLAGEVEGVVLLAHDRGSREETETKKTGFWFGIKLDLTGFRLVWRVLFLVDASP